MAPGALGEIEHPRRQFVQHPLARGVLVARVQRRELDRDGGRDDLVFEAAAAANRVDGAAVGMQVAVGVALGQRRLAEHVEEVAVSRIGALPAAGQRLADDRKSTLLNSSHSCATRMPTSASKKPLLTTYHMYYITHCIY